MISDTIDRSCMSTKPHRKRCKICGEQFVYYPFWHHWMAKVNGSRYEAVCRYNCMREVEKREAEKRRLKEEKRIQREEEYNRRRLEAYHAKRKNMPPPEPVPKKSRTKEWYEKKIAEYAMKQQEWEEAIAEKKNAGKWKPMTEPARRAYTEKAGYYRRRLEEVKKEYEEWREEIHG